MGVLWSKDTVVVQDGRSDVLFPHHIRDVIHDGAVDAVDTEAADKHEPLERSQGCLVLHRQWLRLRSVPVEPLIYKEINYVGK